MLKDKHAAFPTIWQPVKKNIPPLPPGGRQEDYNLVLNKIKTNHDCGWEADVEDSEQGFKLIY